MEKAETLKEIEDHFSLIDSKIKILKGAMYGEKPDIWEDFGLSILNIIYGWDLVNLNNKHYSNFPGIDLGDEQKNIGVQVTIDNSTKHINSTKEKYKDGKEKLLKDKYFNLKFLFISSNHNIKNTSTLEKEKDGFNFSSKNIITFNTLYKEIENIESKEKLLKVLEKIKWFYRNKVHDYFKELSKKDIYAEEISFGNNQFHNDFDKFSETYKFILKSIKRLRKKEHTKKEKLEFYKNIVNNNNYILHFFNNLGKINNNLFDEIIEKVVNKIVEKNYNYKNILVILGFLEKYLNKNNEEIILQVFLNILEKSKEEFVSRKIAIILAKQKLNFINSALVLEVLKLDIKKSQNGFASDFILEFLSKNIDKFNKFEIKEIIKLFNFEKEGKNEFININSYGLRQEKYLGKIIVKILKIDYKLAFLFFGKLIVLEEEGEIKIFNGIKYISYYKFPETRLQIKRNSYNSTNYNIFIEIALELIKFSNSKNNRKLFEEIIKYIIEKGEYSIYYELISFVLIKNKTKNLKLIEKLVKKKEILGVIKFSTKRWGLEIYKYYFNKNKEYIKIFKKNIDLNKLEFALNKDYLKPYFLIIIPKNLLTKEDKLLIKNNEKEYGNINFKDEDSFKITTGYGGEEKLLIKFDKKEKIEEICKKIHIILEKENSFEYWDYKGEFNKYFKNNLGQIKQVYKYISKQNKKEKYILTSHLISTKIEIWKEKYKDKMDLTFYKDLIDIYSILDEEDNNSKINIGQLLDDNGFLRNDNFTGNIQKENKKIYLGLKNIVINLANNKAILEDSDNDGLILGLNTAKGLGVINCSLLFYFYPNDKELKEKIIELSYDKLYGVQATLISNMSLFLGNNYKLVDDILSRYILEQNKIRDYAIVNYFFGGRKNGYGDYKKLYIKIFNYLLKSEESEVQNKIGEILGFIIFSGIVKDNESLIYEYINLLEELIEGHIGNQDSMLGFCFAIQNNFIFGEDKKFDILKNILEKYKDKKLDGKNDSIYFRLSFLFFGDELSLNLFDNFYNKGIFKLLIKKSKESGVFSNINKYLYRLLKENGKEDIDKIINILKLEIENGEDIFDEHRFNGIHKLVKELFLNFDGKNNKICNEIFEKGLESGNKIYLEIFENFYKE